MGCLFKEDEIEKASDFQNIQGSFEPMILKGLICFERKEL